jgi:hypothetical protein
MRRIILITTFVALAPVAFAQTSGNMGTRSNPGASGPPGSMSSGSMNNMGHMGTGSSGTMTGQADPGNCGTPDEPKACPHMPRRALQNYPTNRQ